MCYFRYCDVFSVRKYNVHQILNMAEKRRLNTNSGRFTWIKRKVKEKIVNVCENAAQTEFENLRWNEGRQIVEIGFLAEQLKSCQKCKTTPLDLKDCVGEI